MMFDRAKSFKQDLCGHYWAHSNANTLSMFRASRGTICGRSQPTTRRSQPTTRRSDPPYYYPLEDDIYLQPPTTGSQPTTSRFQTKSPDYYKLRGSDSLFEPKNSPFAPKNTKELKDAIISCRGGCCSLVRFKLRKCHRNTGKSVDSMAKF